GGWTGLGWPVEAGGRGFSVAEQVIFHEEYARAGGPGRMGHIGEGLLGPTLVACGTDDQRARFLPGILAGTQFWCQGYSEPGAGSDLANVRTRAEQDADGAWRVHGQKVWTSLAQDADWIFVLARTDPASRGNKGLSFLLMPLDQPGVEIRPITQLNGGAEFNEVFFDGARAAAERRIGTLYDTGFNLRSRRQFCSRYVREVLGDATGVEVGDVETFATLLERRPGAKLGFWRLWYFGRIPWGRETVTPASVIRSDKLTLEFDGIVFYPGRA
ncbi:hypothetical protein G3N57_07820, partial [Paraburkholderia sp. Se-20369]|nr:hypothetical protein [Paraburkholderia sp. Se-20369]